MLNGNTHTLPPAVPQFGTIRGATIAKKTKWTARERARFAAEWLAGVVQVEPTLKMAAAIFNVSIPYVNEAIADVKADAEYLARGHLTNHGNGTATPISGLDAMWLSMDEDERKLFVLRHLTSVWDAVEAAS
jgi:hypothetical protein